MAASAAQAAAATEQHQSQEQDEEQQQQQQPKFALDVSLYRYAKQLRLLGCDTLCDETVRHARLMALAEREGRILITSVGRLIPMLYKSHRCVADLTHGKAFQYLNKEQLVNNSSNNEQESDNDDGDDKDGEDAKNEGDNNQPTTTDARKFHWWRDQSSGRKRRRRLVGYNSDGESEYEFEDEQSRNVLTPVKNDTVVQQQQQRKPLYLIIDIHANFKQQLGAIIQVCGVKWLTHLLFSRCVKDNDVIVPVEKSTVEGLVSDGIYRLYDQFYQCPKCKNAYWGVDSGAVQNYKAARTLENLRSLFPQMSPSPLVKNGEQEDSNNDDDDDDDASDDKDDGNGKKTGSKKRPVAPPLSGSNSRGRGAARWGFFPRHMFSYPRKVKVHIFSFLEPRDLDNVVAAIPMFRELCEMIRLGLDLRFVPERTRNGRPNPKFVEWNRKQQALREKALNNKAAE